VRRVLNNTLALSVSGIASGTRGDGPGSSPRRSQIPTKIVSPDIGSTTKLAKYVAARNCAIGDPRQRAAEGAGAEGNGKKLDMTSPTGMIDTSMNAAAQIAPDETEPLPWREICARYPDQFVCLVDIVDAEPRSPTIATARVVGHGSTQDAAFEPIRDLPEQFPLCTIRFTGICRKPLIRPCLVLDDEDLESFRS